MPKLVNIKKNDYDIKITRPTNWSNPWSSGDYNDAPLVAENKKEALENYRKWLCGEDFLDLFQEKRSWILNQMCHLKDLTLGCVCNVKKDKEGYQCHGQILIDLIEGKLIPGNIKKQEPIRIVSTKKVKAKKLF